MKIFDDTMKRIINIAFGLSLICAAVAIAGSVALMLLIVSTSEIEKIHGYFIAFGWISGGSILTLVLMRYGVRFVKNK